MLENIASTALIYCLLLLNIHKNSQKKKKKN